MEHRLVSVKPATEASIPVRYLGALAGNEKLSPCCRDVFKHSVEFYRTRDDLAEGMVDKIVIVCGCGRRHVRVAVEKAA